MSVPKKWILAVDDDPDDLFWMEEAIAKASVGDFEYHLSKAGNAVEARAQLIGLLQYCEAADEIIVFSDVNMPTESGLDLLKWLKEQPKLQGIPVVIVASFDRGIEIVQAFELGAVACMFKPPQAKAVKGLLKTITQMYRAKSYSEGELVLDKELKGAVITSPRELVPQPVSGK